MKVTRKLQKWGNSSAVRIPKEAVDRLNLKDGAEVVVHIRQEGILLTPKQDYQDSSLADILRDATPDNAGGELDWGTDVGSELIEDE